MIGPTAGGEAAAEPAKRRVLEELDIESICEEVCGHHHSHKRPRFLEDEQSAVLLDHEALGFDMQHQPEDGPVTRLEVLVVDGTWDDALDTLGTEYIFSGGSTTGPTVQHCGLPLTDLTSVPLHDHSLHHHQQQQHQPPPPQPVLQDLQTVSFQEAFWHQQQQTHQQPPAQPTMPKAPSGPEGGRSRFAAAPQPQPLPPAAYEDQENGNLSWLLDFKLDSFIEAPEDKSTVITPRDLHGNKTKYNGSSGRMAGLYSHDSTKRSCNMEGSGARYDGTFSPSSCGLAENRNRCTGPKKPPFTYTELIEHALQERGELTVSAIYQWISEHFPYYKSNDDRWKNSVRHNLSINPHFRKGSKAPHGAGHLWAIASQDESKPRQLFNIASIRQALKNEEANAAKNNDTRVVTMDEVAAATASITQEQPPEEENIVDTITLEHCAEQILSGIKREVEVQYLVPMMVSSNGEVVHNQQCQQNIAPDPLGSVKETDFLNPVSKEVVAEECGLIGEGYLVTDLNPSSLGLNMAESEVVTTDNLFGEELSFQFYEFASPSQLQSA